MVRKLKTDVKSEAVTMFSSHEENVKWKELDPSELAKIQSMCKDVAWKNHKCKPDVAKAATLLTACQEIITWKGRGDMRPEAATFLTSCKETVCRETISPLSTSEVHVLAVDDSTLDRKVIEKLLRTSSYKVTTVDSATRALEVLGLSDSPSLKPISIQVNLIMTDYFMPEMTGYDLLKRVKAQTSALKDVPVVVMSSENDTNLIERCLAEGAEEFIIKPVQLADVKRLRGHIRPLSRSSSSGSAESSSSSSSICTKRKIGSPEGLQVNTSPERRPRLSRVVVA